MVRASKLYKKDINKKFRDYQNRKMRDNERFISND